MIRRPVAGGAILFVSLLFLLQICFPEWWQAELPVELQERKIKEKIELMGEVKDFSHQEQYGKVVTKVILKDVFLINHKSPQREIKKLTNSNQSIICYLSQKQQLKIGNQLQLSGFLRHFQKATNPGEFDLQTFYRNREVLFSVTNARVLKRNQDINMLRQKLYELRCKNEAILDTYLPKEHASVMKALLLGEKEKLDKATKILYQKNGIAHILSISGLHISLIGMTIYGFFLGIGVSQKGTVILSMTFLLLYGIMVGASPSTVRAVLMFFLLLFAKIVKRSYDTLTALGIAAVVILLKNPLLLWDCGFLLSFAAMLGIAVVYPAWGELKVYWMEKLGFLRQSKSKIVSLFKSVMEGILSSMAVTATTAPILVYFFHEISFLSILLNIFVLPFMAFLLSAGLLLMITEGISFLFTFPFLESCLVCFQFILSKIIILILEWYRGACYTFQKLSIGRRNIEQPENYEILIYYFLIIISTIIVKNKRWHYLFYVILLSLSFLFLPPLPKFSVFNLDVGQGDCSVIFTEEGNTYIIDGGSTSKKQLGERIIIPFLKSRGCNVIDGIFISHLDEDHYNGICELLLLREQENLPVKKLYFYKKDMIEGIEVLFKEHPVKQTKEYQLTMQGLKENQNRNHAFIDGIEIWGISEGVRLQGKETQITCLYPFINQDGLSGNDASLVLRLEYGNFSALFMGDLELMGEQILLRQQQEGKKGRLPCTYLKAGHHGSSSSSCLEFLKESSPLWIGISCGRNNPHGHPHKEALERFRQVDAGIYRTDQSGALQITYDGAKMKLTTFLN